MKLFYRFYVMIVFAFSYWQASAQLPSEFSNFNTTNTSTFTGNNFKAVAVDKNGAVWAGTQYQGLYTFTSSSHTWIKSTTLTDVFINDIKTSKRGGIYVAQSGITGASATEGNRNGAINYFSDEFYTNIATYGVNSSGSGGLNSRNVRALFIDTALINMPDGTSPRVWAAQGAFLTNSNTAAGGIGIGINPPGNWAFSKINKGLQLFPNTNTISSGTPNCEAVGGNKQEVWVFARTNYGGSQILRYDAHSNGFLGGYNNVGQFDNTRQYYNPAIFNYVNTASNVLPAGFRISAIYFDSEGRRWLGTPGGYGSLYVVQGALWTKLILPVLPVNYAVNNNAIAEDADGNVYIGTDNGLLVYRAGEDPALAASFQLVTMSNGLPSNNITGVAVDSNSHRVILATSNGLSFWNRLKPVKTELAWDYSFPMLSIQPRGVAADGVGRVYMKIKRNSDTLPPIKNVEVFIKDFNTGTANLRGKLKKAFNVTSYSDEASIGSGSEASRTDSNALGEFIFWYVSPEDFSADPNGPYSLLPERKDTIKIRVTYANDVKDSTDYYMRVVRAPLLMVHGLAAGPSTWDSCRPATSGPLGMIPYVSNPLFKYKKALTMDGRGLFEANARRLLSADDGDPDAKANSLQGNIEELRNMGFAANQVDYVCHSMGGIMIRGAMGWFNPKFVANGNFTYNNYGKGFVHKLIFVNTPHNSSPVADGVREFVPRFPPILKLAFTALYKLDPKRQQPFDFIQPLANTLLDPSYTFRSSDAVTNLQISDAYGGTNLPQNNNIKHHIIAGDVNITSQVIDSLVGLNKYVKLVNGLMRVARDYYPAPAQQELTPYFDANKTEIDRMLFFVNWYSAKKNFPSFTADGDLVVPLTSQLVRQQPNLSHITIFNNSVGSLTDASHVTMLPRNDVGRKIFDLLNTNVNNNSLFGDMLPANTDPEPQEYFRQMPGGTQRGNAINEVTITTVYDKTKIEIVSPGNGSATIGDNTLAISYTLKDTVGLAYTNIHFQDTDSFKINRATNQQVNIRVAADLAGPQTLYATAVYDKPGGVFYYIDSLTVNVGYQGALQGFRIKEDAAIINTGTPFYPSYEVKYNNQWISLPNGLAVISVAFDSANVINYNAGTKGFEALKNGAAVATVTYQGFEDEILLSAILSHQEACTNKTIASGSFKNPSIWNKGIVPVFCDSLVIQHNVLVDTSIQFTSLRINAGASLTINNPTFLLQLGGATDGNSMIDNYGTLNISGGTVNVKGRIKMNSSSTFSMTGGLLQIGGNTGIAATSLSNGSFMFDVSPAMASFSFTGGILQITDPPLGATGQAINCGYDFGDNTTLLLGNGISVNTSNNPNGFGGNLFPNKIGKLILDAATANGNRQLKNTKPLTIKTSATIKAGSNLIQNAPINVQQ